MKRRKGFTLIELMVVVLIVAVLAALLVPMLTARLEAARWAEAKAGAGTLATAIRAMVAEQGEEMENLTDISVVTTYLNPEDLRGKYFSEPDYTVAVVSPSLDAEYPVQYLITVGPPSDIADDTITPPVFRETGYTLDHTGKWIRLGLAE